MVEYGRAKASDEMADSKPPRALATILIDTTTVLPGCCPRVPGPPLDSSRDRRAGIMSASCAGWSGNCFGDGRVVTDTSRDANQHSGATALSQSEIRTTPPPSLDHTDSPASLSQLPRGKVIGTLIGILLALLMSALDQTIVGTAMPRIVGELHGFEHYAWVSTEIGRAHV